MGGAACKIIINGAGGGLAVLDTFKEHYPEANTTSLRAFIQEAQVSIMYTSLYFKIEGVENVPAPEYTQPIIDTLKRIINELPNIELDKAQGFISRRAIELRRSLDKLEELFN